MLLTPCETVFRIRIYVLFSLMACTKTPNTRKIRGFSQCTLKESADYPPDFLIVLVHTNTGYNIHIPISGLRCLSKNVFQKLFYQEK